MIALLKKWLRLLVSTHTKWALILRLLLAPSIVFQLLIDQHRKMANSNIERRKNTEFLLHFIKKKSVKSKGKKAAINGRAECENVWWYFIFFLLRLLFSLINITNVASCVHSDEAHCRRGKKSSLANMCIISAPHHAHVVVSDTWWALNNFFLLSSRDLFVG